MLFMRPACACSSGKFPSAIGGGRCRLLPCKRTPWRTAKAWCVRHVIVPLLVSACRSAAGLRLTKSPACLEMEHAAPIGLSSPPTSATPRLFVRVSVCLVPRLHPHVQQRKRLHHRCNRSPSQPPPSPTTSPPNPRAELPRLAPPRSSSFLLHCASTLHAPNTALCSFKTPSAAGRG